MTGISTLKRRRFPASLSRRPMPETDLVMTRNRFDRGNHLLVRDFVGAAGEARVAPIHEDCAVGLGIASQSGDQLPPFSVVEGPEIHTTFSFPLKNKLPMPQSTLARSVPPARGKRLDRRVSPNIVRSATRRPVRRSNGPHRLS